MFWKRGRKTIKTSDYTKYQNEIRDEIMDVKWPFEKSEVVFIVVAGLSNRGADLDNCIKPLLDTFQNIFEEFNDNKVYEIHMTKDIVQKGKEYIDVEIQARSLFEV